ncbi:MAG: hypothetical protein COW01_09875 [Bdellovibrionales bacterium CG12_big_fil_rev_8_21_14_0_65_38_15]|nr:MAG: hypothetical protein COW79_06660 [Bdellovibrionales bacterium CG22_combo_CG10-13_8_21_14_all_38_13]PIQ54444.1 MAG: hypothetical protein COW01_09875 [Bdellovibrionales bacterium CG12_big_fil_rev_8_21_14_0_65_38_15]PIR31493.1 MAG: hypothetical protein COV38_00200 [Bdellovibrionales bacterium CG11_big_fil_rev_8_21_14_0_20_38_13]
MKRRSFSILGLFFLIASLFSLPYWLQFEMHPNFKFLGQVATIFIVFLLFFAISEYKKFNLFKRLM